MYLKQNDLTQSINDYIKDHHQAVLLDGAWGTGKTYFVKNVLIPELDKNFNNKDSSQKAQIVYLSLYGVSSLTDIQNGMYMSLIESLLSNGLIKNNNAGQLIKGAKFLSKILLPHLDVNQELINSADRKSVV